MKFFGFKPKLILLVIGLSVIPLVFSVFLILSRVKKTFLEIQDREVKRVVTSVEKKFKAINSNTLTYVGLIASMPEIQVALLEAVTSNDRASLITTVNKYYRKDMGTLQVIDNKGKVWLRADDLDSYGDSKAEQYLVKRGFAGETVLGIESGKRGYAVRAVAPLKRANEVNGVIMVGKFLNDKFASELADFTSCGITFFYEGTLTGSSLWDEKTTEVVKKQITEQFKGILKKKKIISFNFDNKPFSFSTFSYKLDDTVGDATVDIVVGISHEDFVATRKRIFYTAFFLLVCVSIAAIIIGSFFAQGLTNPLVKVSNFLTNWKGDLTEKIEVNTKDETARITKSVNKLMMTIKDIISEVHATSERVASSSDSISSTTQEMSKSAQDIANAVIQISKGATIQSQRVKETFGIMDKSVASIKEMVSNAQSASKAVSLTSTRAETSGMVVNKTVQRIERVTNTVLESAQVIQGLGQMSQQISAITETITSIADQTNLLALNAAIEAARAGEAGRGFAVVAEEVRKLAEGSAESVRKIGGLIKSIQTETNRAVNAIQSSSKEVQEGKAEVATIVDVLSEINKSAQEAAGLVEQIVSTGQERVYEVERVVEGLKEIDAITTDTTAKIEGVTSTTEEQTAAMEEMAASVQELANLASNLKEMVSKFKIS